MAAREPGMLLFLAIQASASIRGWCLLGQTRPSTNPTWEKIMNIHAAAQPLIALIAGVLILIMPRLLNYVVAVYLIIVGLLGLFPLLR